ncbi:TonB-dependent receptor domain-containing protein [Teredinibacter purpureus]|uniref:TonB-dependent receptor domain-containing protein n=1 Tax=Teredinibacter purpureus TaxID=2731756 RepID=UPI0005F7FD30|nr:TonB-dependent receptor [Teredinibacter purpureus]
MIKKTSLLSAAIASIVLPSFAQESIETVLVVGEREPGNMLLDDEALQRIQAATLEDIFSNQSSVAVGGGSATAQKIYVRGFEDVMLNVTVDGAQSPGELYHHQARVQLEPEFIKRIELDAGAGAATNGAGALTGALRVTLKNAFDMLEDDANVGALVKGTYMANGDNGSKITGSAYGRLSDNTGVIVGFSGEDRKDYADGNGDVVEATPYQHDRSFLKLNSGAGHHSFDFTLENVADSATTYERPNLTNYAGRFQLSDQELNRNTVSINYGFDPSSEAVDLHITAYTNDSDFKVQRQNADVIYGEGDFGSIGFDVRNSTSVGSQNITYGIDYRADNLTSAQNATPPFAWGTTEQSASVTGVYVQDNWAATPQLNIAAGIRYDSYSLEGDSGVSDGVDISDSGISPNLSAAFEVTDSLELRVAYAQAFRGVTIREAFFSGLYLHDGTLESEKADNIELGIAYEKNNMFARATLYEQNIENFIDVEYTGGDVWGYWRNVGDAKVEGYEFEAGYNFDNITATLGVWDADNTLNGEPLSDRNMGLGTTIGRTWLGALEFSGSQSLQYGVNVRFVESEKNSVVEGAPDKESYSVVKAYGNWSPVSSLTVSLTVNNLLNEFYYDHATYTYLGAPSNTYVGYPAMGREVVASLAYRF